MSTENTTETPVAPKDKAAELADMVAQKTATAVSSALAGPLSQIAEALKGNKAAEAPKEPEVKTGDPTLTRAAEIEDRMKDFESRIEQRLNERISGHDGSATVGAFDILKMGVGVKAKSELQLRVKKATERYDGTTKGAVRTKGAKLWRGTPLMHKGKQLDEPSELRKALARAWFKFEIDPRLLNPHERELVAHILHNEKFYIGPDGTAGETRTLSDEEIYEAQQPGRWSGNLGIFEKAAILDDSTSGGQNAVPEFFDYDMILLPILGNELAPLCHIIDVPRGSAAQNFTIGNFAFTSGSTEGSAITLATTTSHIAAHDTTFYRAAVGVEIGLNFLEDAVPGLLDTIISRIQAKAAEWADEQVAIGDGTTEPQGVMNASGTADVTMTTATTGPYVISDVLNMLFGVTKPYRTNYDKKRAAFGMTETTYKSLRAIATGVTGDTRLIFGEDVESFELFQHPVAIIATTLANDQWFFVQAGGYRLYRRQPVRIRREMGGVTLLKTNTMVVGADMRWGGQLDRGGYACVTNSGIP